MNDQSNPLLGKFQTPFEAVPFDIIKAEDFVPALTMAIKDAKIKINAIKDNTNLPTFENTIEELEHAEDEIRKILCILNFLIEVKVSINDQNITKDFYALYEDFNNDLILDQELFKKIKKVWESCDRTTLSTEQITLLDNAYRSAARSGANLDEKEREKLKEISLKLASLSLEFAKNLLKETNDFLLIIDNLEDLEGLPERNIAEASDLAIELNKNGKWVFSLKPSSVIPFLTYIKDRELRKKMFIINESRGIVSNKDITISIARLRHQYAQILGHKSFAHYQLEYSMASTPENVQDFLSNIRNHAKEKAVEETEELKAIAYRLDGITDFQKWDVKYYYEILLSEKLNIDDEILSPYFELKNSVDGLFQIAKKLFGLSFHPLENVPLYHNDVQAYQVRDENNSHLAVVYFDLFQRQDKSSDMFVTNLQGPKKLNGEDIRPHVGLVCNFPAPTPDRPTLLTLRNLTVLFHEFGHALHAIFSNTQYENLSSMHVYTDFVELPSQILENWIFEKESLDLFARHYQTGELIPSHLISQLQSTPAFLSGRATFLQLIYASLDLAWHTNDHELLEDIEKFEVSILNDFALLPHVEGTYISTDLDHIFVNGYSAGYYGYKWAEVLSSDTFDVFKRNGIFNREVANKFKETILSKGGSSHPMNLYMDFMGRPPKSDALLIRAGFMKKDY